MILTSLELIFDVEWKRFHIQILLGATTLKVLAVLLVVVSGRNDATF
jgi:H+/Cl- antiporter ClcA